jgi:hypothetical protein
MPILPVRPDPDLSCLRGFRWQNVAIGDLHANVHLLSMEQSVSRMFRAHRKVFPVFGISYLHEQKELC